MRHHDPRPEEKTPLLPTVATRSCPQCFIYSFDQCWKRCTPCLSNHLRHLTFNNVPPRTLPIFIQPVLDLLQTKSVFKATRQLWGHLPYQSVNIHQAGQFICNPLPQGVPTLVINFLSDILSRW